MDLEVVGRHSLLFDDDSMAAFVNSSEALIEWNSLSIDRYDVRHLLPGLPPLRTRRHQDSPLLVDSLETELDVERYLDLSFLSEEQKDTGRDNEDTNHYNAVGFSYGDGGVDSAEGMSATVGLNGSSFQPPFPVPDSVRQSIPPTEKVHQIIARTATFVSEHGGQSEIVLRVKQGNNPSFGFLMPDHHLHAYFRFLVDHQELLKPNANENSQDVKKTDDNLAVMDGSGALSLLGSVYGSGEDEDDAAEHAAGSVPGANESMETSEISNSREVTHMNLKGSSVTEAGDLPKRLDRKEKVSSGKKGGSLGAVKTRTGKGTKKVTEASGSHLAYSEKSPSPVLSDSKLNSPILDPPPELKRVVDKIVEFILKNGKQFEAVLLEQDSKHGRFPFLARSNQYHPYYLKALQSAQEFKSAPKGSFAEKGDSKGPGNTKVALSSGNDVSSLEFAELPNADHRKERFKMILGKSKKDGPDQCSKDPEPNSGISVDATQAAAILQAARRGIRLPKMEILSKTSLGGSDRGDERQASDYVTSHQSIGQKQSPIEVGEANSSEPYMTDEQRLKADRLRRAKMFVARLKSGSVPLGIETSRGASAERPESAAFGFVPEVENHAEKDIEHGSVSQNLEASHENEKSDMKCFDGEYKERRSKRSYRGRSERKDVDNENADGSDGEENDKEENDHKKPRKKRRSHRSSHHHSKERHRHTKRSSSKDRESRRRYKRRHDSSSDEERYHQISSSKDTESRHSHKHRHDRFSDEEDHHRHSSLKDKESRHRRKHSHDSSSDEERYKHHRGRSRKHTSLEAREGDLEEGEISTRLSKANDSATRETSADLHSLCQDGGAPSPPPETATEVSDDLRAKIRAMLLATL